MTSLARRAWPLAALAGGALAAVLLAGPPGGQAPLDPAGTGPTGVKALVDTLAALGVGVTVGSDVADDARVALVLSDDLADGQHRRLRRWVRDGGRLVLADPGSPLAPGRPTDPVGLLPGAGTTLSRRCALPALRGVGRVRVPDGVVIGPPARSVRCFPSGDGHWLVAARRGRGTVVALGGPGVWTNAALGAADNAVLAAALLHPAAGALALVRGRAPGAGDTTLADLLPRPVGLALAQLALAFAVVVAWRARRLGRPVSEPQAVELAGSALVVAVGNLLRRGRNAGHAARLLRADLRRSLGERLGLPSTV
ncbi:MAG: DUF4350 domain-containing protein, partial [Actinobacteria bacterium]|nr:DUF4350 domain-containing protein [Actinomycetota bacterium]